MDACNLQCKCCGRNNFKSARSLTQHLRQNVVCSALHDEEARGSDINIFAVAQMPTSLIVDGNSSRFLCLQPQELTPNEVQQGARQLTSLNRNSVDQLDYAAFDGAAAPTDVNPDDWFADNNDEEGDTNNADIQGTSTTELRDICNNYLQKTEQFAPITGSMKTAIELMFAPRNTKSSLKTYEKAMEWHLKTTGELPAHGSLANANSYLSRKEIFRFLAERYNRINGYNKIHQMVLPSSKTKVNLVLNDPAMCIQSLLTEPRINPDDFLFWGDNPFAPPPSNLNYIADLNTGKAYLKTYEELITNPQRQILLPIVLYIDATETGHFANLPITPVRIALGIHKRVVRTKDYAWRTICFLPEINAKKSRGKRLLIDSGHVESRAAHVSAMENEGVVDLKNVSKHEDFHAMLDVAFEKLVQIINSGFIWDFQYKGKEHKGVEMVPFVAFIKCDTDEADMLCGSYKNRSRHVAQLCRHCECPTNKSDNPLADYPLKTPNKITRLINRNDLDGLQKISQKPIKNACYNLRFGLHNNQGVHGACPMEMLHHICLGIFKYIRDCFFEQLGDKSKISDEADSLAREYAELFARQSERELPRFTFGNGIRGGKLMAKEYPGIMLLILCVFKSTAGRKLLAKKSIFQANTVITDWIMMLETVLQWECWMKSSEIPVHHVRRAKKKHRYIMYLIKKVGNRTKGMGLKTCKFHGICHLAEDILNFGVPMEVDTGSNEEHHKKPKEAAKLTQKKKEMFQVQTALRIWEMDLLELAQEEFEGRCPWECWSSGTNKNVSAPEELVQTIGGASHRVMVCAETGRKWMAAARAFDAKKRRIIVEQDLVDFVAGLCEVVKDHVSDVLLMSKIKRNDQIFRGSLDFMTNVWRDWAMIDWGEHGVLPCKIYGFIDLRRLPCNFKGGFGGLGRLTPGICAVVESTIEAVDDDNMQKTELFTPIMTETASLSHDGYVTGFHFYLADVEAFAGPAIVVPDIGGKKNACWHVSPVNDWAKFYEEWLEQDHETFDISDDESEEEEEEEETSSEDSGASSADEASTATTEASTDASSDTNDDASGANAEDDSSC